MLSSPSLRLPAAPLNGHPFVAASGHPSAHRRRDLAGPRRPGANREVLSSASSPSASLTFPRALRKSVPLAASAAILLWSHPVDAGILSGFSGLESIPGPELPQMDFLKQWSEEKQKKYEELDSKFKSSPVLKELLEKSKLNKARMQTISMFPSNGGELLKHDDHYLMSHATMFSPHHDGHRMPYERPQRTSGR